MAGARKQTVAQDARQAPILVTGNNVEVTEPLKEYIEKKIVKVLDKVRTREEDLWITIIVVGNRESTPGRKREGREGSKYADRRAYNELQATRET